MPLETIVCHTGCLNGWDKFGFCLNVRRHLTGRQQANVLHGYIRFNNLSVNKTSRLCRYLLVGCACYIIEIGTSETLHTGLPSIWLQFVLKCVAYCLTNVNTTRERPCAHQMFGKWSNYSGEIRFRIILGKTYHRHYYKMVKSLSHG